MKVLSFALCLAFSTCVASAANSEDIGNNTVCFVPGPHDCAMVAVAEIEKAVRTVDVQAYGFTESHIAQALIDAKSRGVTVRLIADKTAVNERNGETQTVGQAAFQSGSITTRA